LRLPHGLEQHILHLLMRKGSVHIMFIMGKKGMLCNIRRRQCLSRRSHLFGVPIFRNRSRLGCEGCRRDGPAKLGVRVKLNLAMSTSRWSRV
jgi:hypothetical protein